MRKLTAAGIIAAAAMGLSVQARADTSVYNITGGTFSEVEQRCTQIDALFASTDCTYGRNRPQPPNPEAVAWMGPLFSGGHYTAGSPQDSLTYIPTSGTEVPPDSLTGVYIPAVPDGKIQAVVTGTLSINDNGTPGNAADDKISSAFSIGPMVRNVSTGQTTRALQGWTSMDHQMAEITVSSAAANANGGVDYVIGSRGFPTKRCNKDNAADCFPTQNSSNSFSQERFWADIPPNQVGIERTGLLGDPDLGLGNPVQPPPVPPRGNVGATSTATFVGVTCSASSVPPVNDCLSSPLVWGGGEPAGFDNIIMQVSTDSLGAITSALAYYSEEYRIGFGATNQPNYDNSVQTGTYSFTSPPPIPTARNFAVSVIENSSNNVLNAGANCIGFPVTATVSITTQPTNGVATEANNTIIYTPNVDYIGPDPIGYQCDGGGFNGQGTITVSVEPDTLPVAPDGAISIPSQGAAPGPGTLGTVNVSGLAGYESGNTPSVVTIIPPLAVNGTATVSGTTITFTPSTTFFTGTDTVNYQITDSNGDTASGVIAVNNPNFVPLLGDGSITTDQDRASSPQALLITAGNGSVAQGQVTVTTGASNGTCAVTGTAAAPTLTYTPAAGYFGPDSCVLTITDGDAITTNDTDTGTFSITVNEVDDALQLPGGGGALDLWSLSLLGALPLLRRRRRV